ncbi:hypothetical protein BG003_011292, partial [Podila horticola]
RRNEDLFRGIVLEDFLLEQKNARLRYRKLNRLGEKKPSVKRKVERMRQNLVQLTDEYKQMEYQRTVQEDDERGIDQVMIRLKREFELEREVESYPQKLQDLCNVIMGPQDKEEPPHFQKTLLARYGPCIQTIPNVCNLLEALQDPTIRKHVADTGELVASPYPTEYALLRHLLTRCPKLRIPVLRLSEIHLGTPRLLDLIIEFLIPVTTELVIDYEFTPGAEHVQLPLTTSVLKRILSNTTSTLQKLLIKIDHLFLDEPNAESGVAGAREFEPSIQELYIHNCGYDEQSIKFWDWLWKRCEKVQTLSVRDVLAPVVQGLAKGIASHMPNIENILLGEQTHHDWIHLEDSELELLLSAPAKTYKKIICNVTTHPGPLFAKALKRHFPTLEEFWVARSAGNDSYLVDMLVRSPKLRTLMALREGDYPTIEFPKISAKTFVDWNSATQDYRPWACESTLVKMNVKITGIRTQAGPDRKSQHGFVYGRLARLRALNVLALGHYVRMVDASRSIMYTAHPQKDCLAMTLDSGLEKLKPLVNLDTLTVTWMCHKTTVKDVQWMIKNWPKLKAVRGLTGEPLQSVSRHYPHLDTSVE